MLISARPASTVQNRPQTQSPARRERTVQPRVYTQRESVLTAPGDTSVMKQVSEVINGVLGHDSALVRLYYERDNLG